MDWEDLLHSLWDLLTERGSAELEKRIWDGLTTTRTAGRYFWRLE